MTPRVNKFTLTTHVTCSVGWLGAVAAYLCLAIAGLTSHDAQLVRGAYVSMGLIGWYVIVPLSLAALLTGLIQSLGTTWGLFRHWWVLAKFVLTTAGTVVLLRHMTITVSRIATMAAEGALSGNDVRGLQVQLVIHAAGGLVVLLAATVLSVYKPWGPTPYGRRHSVTAESTHAVAHRPAASGRPRWVNIVGAHALVLAVVHVLMHLAGGGLRVH